MGTPVGSKSATLRVTIGMRWTRPLMPSMKKHPAFSISYLLARTT